VIRAVLVALAVAWSGSAAAEPIYLQCGWEGPKPESWTFQLDPDARTVAMVPPSMPMLEPNFGDEIIEFHTYRTVTYDSPGWWVDQSCKDWIADNDNDMSKAYRENYDRYQACAQTVDQMERRSITRFQINRVNGAFNYLNTPLGEEPAGGRTIGICQKIQKLF